MLEYLPAAWYERLSLLFLFCLFPVLTLIPNSFPAGTREYFLAMVPCGQFPAQDCLVCLLQFVPSSYVPRSSIHLARPATRLASLTPTRTWAPRAVTRAVRWGTLNLCVRLSAAGSPKSWTKCATYRGWISATNPNVSSQQWFNMNWNQGGTFCTSSNTANTSLLQLRNMILRKHEFQSNFGLQWMRQFFSITHSRKEYPISQTETEALFNLGWGEIG